MAGWHNKQLPILDPDIEGFEFPFWVGEIFTRIWVRWSSIRFYSWAFSRSQSVDHSLNDTGPKQAPTWIVRMWYHTSGVVNQRSGGLIQRGPGYGRKVWCCIHRMKKTFWWPKIIFTTTRESNIISSSSTSPVDFIQFHRRLFGRLGLLA